jgi:hypothetical protein
MQVRFGRRCERGIISDVMSRRVRGATMSNDFPPEIKQLIDQNMATGMYGSENEVLQAALHVLSDYNDTVADVRQGVSDYEQGLGVPMQQVFQDVRRQLGSET